LSDETIERFGLGFAPNEWDALIANFQGKGRQLDDLVEAGLISERESGGYYDRFRNRVLFPIRDSRGGMAGFGARALAPDDVPKYLYSPQTLLFDKSALLYGLDKARRAIRGQDEAVIVEGYMDVIALHQAGFENVVSPMGTALTEQQLRHVKRLTHRIVLALDADAAGTQATLRGLEVARQTLDREDDPVYNPRGLLRHEARLQADIRVTTLPEDKDPDEVVQANPEAWSRLLIDARPIVEHVMLSLSSGRDLEDPKVKSEIAEQVMPLIGDLPNPIERDTYTQKLAHLLHLDERTLMLPPAPRRTRRAHGVRRQRVRESAAGEPKPNFGENTRAEIEAHILGVLIRNPELIYRINRSLEEEELARITSNDFENTDLQEMFRLAQSSLEQDLIEPSSFAIENIPFPLLDRANEIMQNGIAIDARTQKVFEDIIRTIVRLRRKSLETTIDQLRFLIENEWERNDRSMDEYLAVMKQNTNMLHKLEKTMGQFSERKLSSAR
jgi:DNA primase